MKSQRLSIFYMLMLDRENEQCGCHVAGQLPFFLCVEVTILGSSGKL